MHSQEIHAKYKHKKEKTKSRFLSGVKWNYVEFDSLVLYQNGEFYRNRFYRYHQVIFTEYKGNWKTKNGILSLETNQFNTDFDDKNWLELKLKFEFLLKKRKLIPLSDLDMHIDRILKLQ